MTHISLKYKHNIEFACPDIGKSLEEVIDGGMQHSAYNPWSLFDFTKPQEWTDCIQQFKRQVNNLAAISEAN